MSMKGQKNYPASLADAVVGQGIDPLAAECHVATGLSPAAWAATAATGSRQLCAWAAPRVGLRPQQGNKRILPTRHPHISKYILQSMCVAMTHLATMQKVPHPSPLCFPHNMSFFSSIYRTAQKQPSQVV